MALVSSALLRLGAQVLGRRPGTRAYALAHRWRDLAGLAEADIAFVSYPKSGRTFVRAMLARLFQIQHGIDERELLRFQTLKGAAPEVPRLFFTHDGPTRRRPDQMSVNQRAYAGLKVVVLARHPGDVALSRYHHLKHRSRSLATRARMADMPIEDFIWAKKGGIPSNVAYLNAWAALQRQRAGISILRYEDFRDMPEATLSRLAELVGLAVSEADIADAVAFTRFDNLKAKEREGYFSSARLRPRIPGDDSSSKVRSGRSGGYREALGDGSARVDSYIEQHLDPIFGYGRGAAG